MGLYVFSWPIFSFLWMQKHVYFTLVSSRNRKYELLAITYGSLYVFLSFYISSYLRNTVMPE